MINYHNVICKFDFPCNCVSSYLRAIIINAPINVKPQGEGRGQTQGNLTF